MAVQNRSVIPASSQAPIVKRLRAHDRGTEHLLQIDPGFLTHQSRSVLQSFMLAELSRAANLQADLETFLSDSESAKTVISGSRQGTKAIFGAPLRAIVDRHCNALLAQWVLNGGLEELVEAVLAGPRSASESLESIKAELRAKIRNLNRSPEEIAALAEWRKRVSEDPGASHRKAVANYQARNLAAGKCMVCPRQRESNSEKYCSNHASSRPGTKGRPPAAAVLQAVELIKHEKNWRLMELETLSGILAQYDDGELRELFSAKKGRSTGRHTAALQCIYGKFLPNGGDRRQRQQLRGKIHFLLNCTDKTKHDRFVSNESWQVVYRHFCGENSTSSQRERFQATVTRHLRKGHQ